MLNIHTDPSQHDVAWKSTFSTFFYRGIHFLRSLLFIIDVECQYWCLMSIKIFHFINIIIQVNHHHLEISTPKCIEMKATFIITLFPRKEKNFLSIVLTLVEWNEQDWVTNHHEDMIALLRSSFRFVLMKM